MAERMYIISGVTYFHIKDDSTTDGLPNSAINSRAFVPQLTKWTLLQKNDLVL